MRLYVDLETLQLIEGPGFRNPVSSLRFKRGDAARLEVEFLRSGTTPETIGDAATLSLQFGIKPRGRYDVSYLVHEDTWTFPDDALHWIPQGWQHKCSQKKHQMFRPRKLGPLGG